MTDPDGDARTWTWRLCRRCGDPTARSIGWHRWCDPDKTRRRASRPEGHDDLFETSRPPSLSEYPPPLGGLFDEGA